MRFGKSKVVSRLNSLWKGEVTDIIGALDFVLYEVNPSSKVDPSMEITPEQYYSKISQGEDCSSFIVKGSLADIPPYITKLTRTTVCGKVFCHEYITDIDLIVTSSMYVGKRVRNISKTTKVGRDEGGLGLMITSGCELKELHIESEGYIDINNCNLNELSGKIGSNAQGLSVSMSHSDVHKVNYAGTGGLCLLHSKIAMLGNEFTFAQDQLGKSISSTNEMTVTTVNPVSGKCDINAIQINPPPNGVDI